MKNQLEKLNAAYKKALGAILLKGLSRSSFISIGDVLIDPSGQTGRVWLSADTKTLEEIETNRANIQRQLAKRVQTRYTPKLTFLRDDNYLSSIDSLFNHLNES